MTRARIIHLRKARPDGSTAEWFEIETIHGAMTHRSRTRTFPTAEAARAHAEETGLEVEAEVVEDW